MRSPQKDFGVYDFAWLGVLFFTMPHNLYNEPNMTLRQVTTLYIWAVLFTTIVYDVWVYYQDPTATISRVIVDAAQRNPMLAVCIGAVVAHFFWGMTNK